MRKATARRLAKAGIDPKSLAERSQPQVITSRYQNGRLNPKSKWETDTRAIESPKWEIPAWQTIRMGRDWIGEAPDFSDLAAPGIIRYREKAERRLREAVPGQIAVLLRRYFDFDPMPFHVALLREMFAGGRFVRCWPSDYAKSTTTSFWFPLLSMMNDPNESHIIVGANLADSKSRVADLQDAILSNEALIRDYPWIGMPTSRQGRIWSTTQFNVVGRDRGGRNPNILAGSTTMKDIKGRRGKLIIDDAEGPEHMTSHTERMKLYNFIKLAAIRTWEERAPSDKPNCSPRPLAIAVGTPFDTNSIYFRLRDEGWDAEFLPYINPETKRHIWPAKADKVAEQKEKMTSLQFAIAYRMDPTDGGKAGLSWEELRRRAREGEFIPADKQDFAATLISLDPASGSTGRQADYAGISVVKIFWPKEEQFPFVEVLECRACTEGPDVQVQIVQEIESRYPGARIIYEGNSQQAGNYSAWFKQLAPELLPKLIRHQTTKENKQDITLGLKTLKSLLQMGRLKVHGDIMVEGGPLTLLEEVRDLGQTGAHDHIAASVWFVTYWAHLHHRYGKVRIRNTFRRPPIARFGWR